MEYTTELLAHGTQVCVNKTHRFGTDAMLLSHFCALKRLQAACDFGTGCGIIPLRWRDMGHI
ncbi:MAG: SAM-dependent methyltransferase, partial [Oscillospiraceae bacterium]|nr:SAM-dependent methyltransferase [Oscillospiraceae bacterium]